MNIVKEETYRSVPLVNVRDDVVRVTITCTRKECRILKSQMRDKCDEQKNKEIDLSKKVQFEREQEYIVCKASEYDDTILKKCIEERIALYVYVDVITRIPCNNTITLFTNDKKLIKQYSNEGIDVYFTSDDYEKYKKSVEIFFNDKLNNEIWFPKPKKIWGIHIYEGDCPDETNPYRRDPKCEVCRAIMTYEKEINS